MAQQIDPAKLQQMVDLLNETSTGCLTLHKNLHGKQGDAIPVKPVVLNDQPTSLLWAADLADNLATNTSNVRNEIRVHDKIYEQQVWPDSGPMVSGDQDALLQTIIMWLQMESMLFKAMITFYPIQINVPHKDCATVHDVLNELATNAVAFINAENNTFYAGDPIDVVQPPQPPVDGSAGPGSVVYSLGHLEQSLHRLVQTHMQIATFIPAHLRFAGIHRYMK